MIQNNTVKIMLIVLFALNQLAFSQSTCGFYYKKAITINGAQISGGPHIDFPVLISHTDPDLILANGKVTNANGFDIVFADNSNNLLDFQLEYYNSGTGEYTAWVKIPSITSGVDVPIQILYGNAGITTNQSSTNTWSSGYHGAWHMQNNVTDNSANNVTSVNNGSGDVIGKINRGRVFTDPNHWIELTNFPNLTTDFTITGWVRTSNRAETGQRVFCDDVNNTGGYALSLGDNGAGSIRFYSRGSNPVILDGNGIVNNVWHHIAAVADITNGRKRIYIDGTEVANAAFTNAWGTDDGNASIGGETAAGEAANRFNGRLDEIRVASRALSGGWILTERRSHNQPTTTVGVVTAGDFYTVSTEQQLGNPNEFGNNIWHAYCFNTASYSSTVFNYTNYRGYYTIAGLNFSSTAQWAENSNPSTAPGYTGCSVTNDLHIVRYKRQGFTCGYYQINIAGPSGESGHDDATKLFIDGVQVYTNTGCCAARNNAWTGYLGPNSRVELAVAENGGNAHGRLTFISLPHPTVTPDVTICAGSNTTLTASGAANYSWTTNTTHLVAPYTNASVVCSPPGATPSSIQTYTVSTTNAATGCTISNTIDVTINPLPTTAVTPTTAGPFCASSTVNAIASGANTYTWSPMTAVTVNSGSGHDVTLTPTTTTTYTVTGSNNCATNTATVTITVNTPTGNPAVFGTNTWNVYAYNGNNFNTFYGSYTHNTLDFDTRTVWNPNNSPSLAAGYVGCVIPNDNHSFTYKRRGFDCGFYQLNIPNHDDNVNLIVNGVSVFSQAAWFNNIAKPNVWQGYLGSDTEVEYEIREAGGGSHGGLTFTYLYGPQNSANQTVWHGSTNNQWTTSSNWCGSLPSPTVSAYLPYNYSNTPQINTTGAETNSIFIQANATLTVNPTRTLNVYGTWTNNGTLTPNGGTIDFMGSAPITIGGSATTTFTDLQIDNSNLTALTLAANTQISGNLTFVQGNIYTGANSLIFLDGATCSGMSNDSYVSGTVRKVGNDAFTFPIGKNGFYAPVSISAPSDIADYFTAEYFNSDPNGSYSASSKDVTIDHISPKEYWIINRSGASNVSVSLSWNKERSGIVNAMNELLVARWDGLEWQNHGNGGTTGIDLAGTVSSSGAISTFSPFTLGSGTANNPLPIDLLSFEATLNSDNKVTLKWSTAMELNNDYFTIEKSLDGLLWEKIATIAGAGNSNTTLTYQHTDTKPSEGVSYYRLKQTDLDGTYSYSAIRAVDSDYLLTDLMVYPNPIISNETNLIYTNRAIYNGRLTLSTLSGQLIMENIAIDGTKLPADILLLDEGVYLLEINEPTSSTKIKLIKN